MGAGDVMVEAVAYVPRLVSLDVFIGFKDPFRLAGGSVVVYGPLVALVVLVAAALPAWRTSRLEVVGSLRYE